MSIKSLLFSTFTGFIITLGIWLLVIFNTDPFKADAITIGTFYVSLFLSITCILGLIGYYLRIQITNKEVVYAHYPIAMRQASIIAFLAISLLAFQSLKILTWWVGGILAIVLLMVELFFNARKA